MGASWAIALLLGVSPGIHRIESSEQFITLHTAGLSLESLAPLDFNDGAEASGVRNLVFRLPRQPRLAEEGKRHYALPGMVGVFRTGAPIFHAASTQSYRGQGLWHFDAVARQLHQRGLSGKLSAILAQQQNEPVLLGFALDGFPIYAAPGRSGYRLRGIAKRTHLPDGTALSPGQEGPEVSTSFPLGSFAEDYEFVGGTDTLDECNGRHLRTREYPDGTYAYILATDSEGSLAVPYLVGQRFRGLLPLKNSPDELRFPVGGWRFLENIHEKPMHLIVVRRDLSSFEHLHPELNVKGEYALDHAFPQAGHYVLFAGYTPAGGTAQVDRRELRVAGKTGVPAGVPLRETTGKVIDAEIEAELEWSEAPVTGKDLRLRFSLRDQRSGHPVRDLSPWLGAWAHVVMIHEDTEEFLHVHPQTEAADHHDLRGPSPAQIEASTGFRKAGLYKAWLQFERAGQLRTLPFVFRVRDGTQEENAPPRSAFQVRVTAHGYEPARLQIRAGQDTEIEFYREDARGCGQELRMDSIGLRRTLPPGKPVRITIPAREAGEISFGCGMGMLRGAIVITGT